MAFAEPSRRPSRRRAPKREPFGARTIKTTGEDLVILARAEFDALLAAAGNEEAETRAIDRIVRASRAAIDRSDEFVLPDWLAIPVAEGEAPLKVVRERAGRTQQDIAAAAGVPRTTLSLIESGEKRASSALLGRLAKSLDVDPRWLEPLDA